MKNTAPATLAGCAGAILLFVSTLHGALATETRRVVATIPLATEARPEPGHARLQAEASISASIARPAARAALVPAPAPPDQPTQPKPVRVILPSPYSR